MSKPRYIKERQVAPELKNFYKIEQLRGFDNEDGVLLCVSYRTLELLHSLKEPKYYARWLDINGQRITSKDDEAFVDKTWAELQEQLANVVRLDQLIKSNLLLYSGLTGEEVDFNLNDPSNLLNSTDKITSSTPFYVPKAIMQDMSLANAIYRSGHADRPMLYNLQYPNMSHGKSLADILKELNINADASQVEQLKALITSMQTIQAVGQGLVATAQAADAAAETAQAGMMLWGEAVDTMDIATNEIRDLVGAISLGVSAIGSLGNALATFSIATTNAYGMNSIKNAIHGVTNELVKLNANVGGPGQGNGWFEWLRYNLFGFGNPPTSYQPNINELMAAHLQAQREMNEVQGGNPNLNMADSIDYIGNGSGQSDK